MHLGFGMLVGSRRVQTTVPDQIQSIGDFQGRQPRPDLFLLQLFG